MTITLTTEIESRLIEHAERLGEDASHLAEEFIAEGLSGSYLVNDPDDLTEEQIAEIREGIKRGLEAEAAGRVKSTAQAVAEARQRHGFPAICAENIQPKNHVLKHTASQRGRYEVPLRGTRKKSQS